MVQVVLLQLRANDTQTAGDASGAAADVLLPGHIVKVNPGTVGAGDDAFGTEYDTILLPFIQPSQSEAVLAAGTHHRITGVRSTKLGPSHTYLSGKKVLELEIEVW